MQLCFCVVRHRICHNGGSYPHAILHDIINRSVGLFSLVIADKTVILNFILQRRKVRLTDNADHVAILGHKRDKDFSTAVNTDAQFLHFDFILNCVVKIETLKINFVCTVEVVVNHLFDHGILADSQHSAHLVAVQRTRETGSAVNRRRSSNVEIITLVVMENIADKLPLDHLCQP